MAYPAISGVVQEMKDVFAAIEAGSIGSEPLKISTQSGRSYEVCYASEISPDVWISTNELIVKGYYICPMCPSTNSNATVLGGNWYQITSKNESSPEPVVRLFEIVHRFKLHPESIDQLATEEKCNDVFGSAIKKLY